MNCLFCNIAAGNVAANIVFENDEIMAFHDIQPQSPTHLLIIPKKHVASLELINPEDGPLLGQLILTAKSLAHANGFGTDGYRLVLNVNQHGGQTVPHIHLHLLGGRRMQWPPG